MLLHIDKMNFCFNWGQYVFGDEYSKSIIIYVQCADSMISDIFFRYIHSFNLENFLEISQLSNSN